MVLPGDCLTIGGNGRDLGGDFGGLAGELADSSGCLRARPLLSITCAPDVPQNHFWRGLPAQVNDKTLSRSHQRPF